MGVAKPSASSDSNALFMTRITDDGGNHETQWTIQFVDSQILQDTAEPRIIQHDVKLMIWWQRTDIDSKPIYIIIAQKSWAPCPNLHAVWEVKLGTYKSSFSIASGDGFVEIVGVQPGKFWWYTIHKDGTERCHKEASAPGVAHCLSCTVDYEQEDADRENTIIGGVCPISDRLKVTILRNKGCSVEMDYTFSLPPTESTAEWYVSKTAFRSVDNGNDYLGVIIRKTGV